MSNSGFVFNIERHSLHDGPGIRTIVFLAGCPLSCLWCANPEGLIGKCLFVTKKKCTGCGACAAVCPKGAVRIEDGKSVTDRTICGLCGKCLEVCAEGAREIKGREMTVDEVIDTVIRDDVFFRQSGGGMTLSGGEPFLQKDFAHALLIEAKDNGINTAVETCGCVPWDHIGPVVKYVNTFLYDVKHMDPDKHKKYTGKDNYLIQENLMKLGEAGANIVVRVPLIPGFNDTKEEIQDIARAAVSAGASRLDILPFHKLAESKHEQLESVYGMSETDVFKSERVDEIASYAMEIMDNVHIEV